MHASPELDPRAADLDQSRRKAESGLVLRVQQLRELALTARNLAAQATDEKTRLGLLMEAATLEAKARQREIELNLAPPILQKAED